MRFTHILIMFALVPAAFADHYVLTRLADNTTPVPGTSTTFTDFTILPPSIHRDSVAFSSFAGKIGIYLHQDGQVLTVADSLSNLPGTTAPLESYRAENIEVRDGGVAFIGWSAGKPGIYLGDGKGSLRRITGAGTNVPGTNAVIQAIEYLSLDGSNIAFSVNGYRTYDANNNFTNYTDADGIYTVIDGTLTRVADRATPVPGGSGVGFSDFEKLSMDHEDVLFVGGGNEYGLFGIYKATSTGVTGLVTGGTIAPGTGLPMNGFSDVSFKQADLGFLGLLPGMESAVLRYYEDDLRTVVQPGTAANENGDTFFGINALGFDGGNMAFLASTRDGNGLTVGTALYSQVGDGFQRALGIGDTLDGRIVQQILFGYHGISGNALAFYVRFTDYSLALYRADLVLDTVEMVTADMDGGAKANVGYYDPSDGTWFVREDNGSFRTRQFGFPGAQSVPGDYDGDGKADVAVYDPYYGVWYILASHDGFQVHQFGYYGAQPVQKDYDGDGRCDLGVYDAYTGDWFVLKTTEGFQHLQFGFYGATPIPADFDGDGKVDIAVFEHARGIWYVLASTAGFSARQFGYYGVIPVAVDFDGQGADYAVFDRNSGVWYTLGQVEGFKIRPFGYSGVLPVSADYDGDAKSDLGVYDPYRAMWYLLRTSAGFRSGGL